MSAGELFLSALRGLHEWDECPAAYLDKSLDRLFLQSAYRVLTDEEQAINTDLILLLSSIGYSTSIFYSVFQQADSMRAGLRLY